MDRQTKPERPASLWNIAEIPAHDADMTVTWRVLRLVHVILVRQIPVAGPV
jgi:hypothetical protein